MTAANLPLVGAIGVTPTGGGWKDGFLARSIRWFTARKVGRRWVAAKVNHAALFLGSVEGFHVPQLIEAQPGGARLRPWDCYGDNMTWINTPDSRQINGTYMPLIIGNWDRKRIAENGLAMLGTPYNFWDILAVAIGQARFHGADRTFVEQYYTNPPWWVRRITSSRSVICSELVDLAYSRAGVHLFADGRESGLVSPADLADLMPAGVRK